MTMSRAGRRVAFMYTAVVSLLYTVYCMYRPVSILINWLILTKRWCRGSPCLVTLVPVCGIPAGVAVTAHHCGHELPR